jgi:hypothetical protein
MADFSHFQYPAGVVFGHAQLLFQAVSGRHWILGKTDAPGQRNKECRCYFFHHQSIKLGVRQE